MSNAQAACEWILAWVLLGMPLAAVVGFVAAVWWMRRSSFCVAERVIVGPLLCVALWLLGGALAAGLAGAAVAWWELAESVLGGGA